MPCAIIGSQKGKHAKWSCQKSRGTGVGNMRKVKVYHAPIHPTAVRISDPRSRRSTLPFFFLAPVESDNRSYTLYSRHEDHPLSQVLTQEHLHQLSNTLKPTLPYYKANGTTWEDTNDTSEGHRPPTTVCLSASSCCGVMQHSEQISLVYGESIQKTNMPHP